ncbi:MAG: hypothetical protein LBV29_02570 [Azoarcus sp.]|jgi:hypothetical protein|nr:hypothetical protein [Azoarcus sp.]
MNTGNEYFCPIRKKWVPMNEAPKIIPDGGMVAVRAFMSDSQVAAQAGRREMTEDEKQRERAQAYADHLAYEAQAEREFIDKNPGSYEAYRNRMAEAWKGGGNAATGTTLPADVLAMDAETNGHASYAWRIANAWRACA